MKNMRHLFLMILFLILGNNQPGITEEFENFITCSKDKLMDGNKKLRFISFNIPNLHYIEDNVPFEEKNPWRLPNAFEITDALKSIKQVGGQVARIYTLSVLKTDDNEDIPRHILEPGKFNESAFIALDKVLQLANDLGIRLIIPFVDNWSWWGGRAEYAAFRGKTKDNFWTDRQIMDDFKKTIHFVLNRINTFTGIKYKDDKAILAWETGNELESPFSWTSEIALYIKSQDQNHLLIDGFHTSALRRESIDDPNIDIVTTHHYQKDSQQIIKYLKENVKMCRDKKPYFVGEFGFIDTPSIKNVLDFIIENNICGGLLWSLRFRNRDGGFYWHSEPYGGDLFKAYLWPGFATGAPYDEINFFQLMRNKAYQIRGLKTPKITTPDIPTLLPIENVAAISWQGSAGACFYNVERAIKLTGPWELIGQNISDTKVQYRPLYNDNTVEIGKKYYYRILAKNGAGLSQPSNVVGPVHISHYTLIDEMDDFSNIYSSRGLISIESSQARKAKEDLHRLKCEKNSSIVYKLPGKISSCKIYTFFIDEVGACHMSVSPDGVNFVSIKNDQKIYYSGAGEYNYWKPVKFTATVENDKMYYIKIDLNKPAQISRIEISYGK